MVDRLLERLSFDPSERTSVDAVDSFVALAHSIFSRRKAVDRHSDYIIERFTQNCKDTEYYVAPKHIESLLGNLLSKSKDDLLVSQVSGINDKVSALLDKIDSDSKQREDASQTFETSYKNLTNQLVTNIETKTKEIETEKAEQLSKIKQKYDEMNNCIEQMTDEQLKSEDSFSVPFEKK